MATISAYATDELKRKIDRIAREEGRSQAQVAATALELYAALAAGARRAYLELRATSAERHEDALGRVADGLSRVLLAARWDLLSERVDRELEERGSLPVGEMGEEQIAAVAVETTARGSGGRRRRAAG